jgi:uncharacterized protein DUF6980
MTSIFEKDFPELFSFIKENKVSIRYFPYERRFAIGLETIPAYQEIFYCPWSGKRLPAALSDEFAEILAERGLSILEPDTWPEDLRDESWWIRAGI